MSLIKSIKGDIQAVFQHDPAATSTIEVLLAYPGFLARQLHRVAHSLHEWRIPILPRSISHLNRFLAGVEIHPGARVGEGFFIDHGMGIVIGETAEIWENMALYQGVTLGSTSQQKTKRHPTLCDNVVVGAARDPDTGTIERLPDPVWEKRQALEQRMEKLELGLTALER